MGSLIHVLESAIELVSLPDNDFCWSSWESEQEAKQEMLALIGSVKAGVSPEKLKISVLFAPTGPLQEVSMSSGWADAYLKLQTDTMKLKVFCGERLTRRSNRSLRSLGQAKACPLA
ncbi:hypothetical protein MST27_19935 [Pseudomonas sp. PS1]|uniref:Uncharacterized protein n=1 Tax=Stutzerimonas marianensis TaxID=2929513 RepID=A0A9X1W6T8_9GAMM|nr:hypothetical protein [Pseudomonas marianensis]MCJ0975643.1 hypothetical protein [Pseudomonas marianensis]